MSSLTQNLGIGVGLRPTHFADFLNHKPKSVQWVEVISENYMPWKNRDFGNALDTLLKIRNDYPVSLHGVSMNLGSVDPIDLDYMNRLKQLINKTNPVLVSDHLSWTGVRGENLHDLIPLPYTEESLNHISEKIDQAQNILGRRLYIENPSSYLEYTSSEMTEVEFINLLLKKTNCGLLLDINNVYVSSINHNFNPLDYLTQIPHEKIGQIHLAGHSQVDGILIDTHDSPVCDAVWDLYTWLLKKFEFYSVMIERDGHIPEWNELEKEILKIGEIHDQVKKSF